MEEQIRSILVEVKPDIGLGEISADLDLRDAGLDSLDMASVLLAIQEKHGIQISDDDADALITISAIASYLALKGK